MRNILTRENLIIAREYIAHGMRERAAELVGLDLGPRTDLEIEARLREDTTQQRWTSIDRRLLRDMDDNRIVSASDPDPFQQSLRAGRLQTLGRLGLAGEGGGRRWQLAENLEARLRQIGERGDIIRTMQRELARLGGGHRMTEHAIFDRDRTQPIVGRLVRRGLADEHRDRHFVLVDATDGRTHYVDIGRSSSVEFVPEGAIVRISPREYGIRDADRTIVAVAAAHGGRYSVDLHLEHDARATEPFAQAHVRRLEAMRRSTGAVQREPDGTWRIAEDHLARVERYEARIAQDRPVDVETLSTLPIERLGRVEAATWLDRELVRDDPEPLRQAGFGAEVQAALAARRQWLVDEQLADQHADEWQPRADMLFTLRRRELLRVAGQLSNELQLGFVEATPGELVDGTLTRRVDLASGRFALVEKAREFTLVPWRHVLERQIGRPVQGLMREDGISWRIGRDRDGPEIG